MLLWSACMSVVCITCLYSFMRHLCLYTCEGVVSKALSWGEGWGYTQPTFRNNTCTYNHRRNHKYVSSSGCLHVAVVACMYIRTSSSVSAHYNIHAGMLQWFTQPAVAQRVTAGGTPVSVNEVYATAESLPDEAVDAELRHLRTCFSEVAWVLSHQYVR